MLITFEGRYKEDNYLLKILVHVTAHTDSCLKLTSAGSWTASITLSVRCWLGRIMDSA